MEIIILLLEGAIKQYRSGKVAIGDNMLQRALKIRTETAKAEKSIAENKTPKAS